VEGGSLYADCASWVSSPCDQLGPELVLGKNKHADKGLGLEQECCFGGTTCQLNCNAKPHLGLSGA